ncbi:vesicle-associated protein 4-2-like isoform X1 [Salvia miltiorrhiza]|uniref:vesicle-associated protein 4-2-like isoform X1 n=1 Tax=Salvia miltiorrhiza TaxID=226208 RepID=UPI0025AD27FF|nr:vesicle-associated protein 4-2-like isoform X1 [Salvia miltiorrhiza]
MPTADDKSDGKVWGLFKMPFRNSQPTTSSSSDFAHYQHNYGHGSNGPHSQVEGSSAHSGAGSSVSSVARSLLPTRRRLKLDPSNKLYFPYEAGKQVRSAIKIKNTSKSRVAFKFQTTEPKSCFMRPPGAILVPGESIIATVFKFVEVPENNEKPMDQKSRVKFKIMSLKVKDEMDYVPELFDEHKDQVAVEQILRVVFLDVERPSPALEKLKRQLAEAEAELEARKKPSEDTGPKFVGEGLVIDEWVSLVTLKVLVQSDLVPVVFYLSISSSSIQKERRERYLARQQVEVSP